MTVGAILSRSFAFLRHNLVTVAVWSVLLFAMGVVSQIVLRVTLPAAALQAPLSPQTPGFWQAFLPLWLVMGAVIVVLIAAINRAVMRPGESAYAALRLGADEGRVLGLFLMLFVLGFVLAIPIMIIVVLIAVVAGVATSASSGAAAGIAVAAMLAIGVAMIGVMVRLIPVVPLTLLRRQIVIKDAWKLSAGHFWVLLGSFLAVMLLSVAILAIYFLIVNGPAALAMANPTDPQSQATLAAFQADQANWGWPKLVLLSIVSAIINGPLFALQQVTAAVATQLLLEEEQQTETARPTGPWNPPVSE